MGPANIDDEVLFYTVCCFVSLGFSNAHRRQLG
ncbi:unnamed protein product [Larinioides sclopetarius]|uniref:Uncharacterized protein n=1 Tax=Larinioides sclopetarius TaxID=280406 RepID=A0AAV2A5B3_9ARAC